MRRLARVISLVQQALSWMLMVLSEVPSNFKRGGWWWSGQRRSRIFELVRCLNWSTVTREHFTMRMFG